MYFEFAKPWKNWPFKKKVKYVLYDPAGIPQLVERWALGREVLGWNLPAVQEVK